MDIKVIILFTLITLTITSAFEEGKQTLEQWFTKISSEYENVSSSDPFYGQINDVLGKKKSCTEEKLVWWNNKQKSLNNLEAIIFIYGAALDCVGNKVDTWKLMVSSLANYYGKTIPQEHIECFKMELQKLDSQNSLLKHEGFSVGSMTTDMETCTNLVDIAGFDDIIDKNEKIFGSLSDLTCSSFNKVEVKKFMLSIVVSSDTSLDFNIKNYVVRVLAGKLKDKMDIAYTCVKNVVARRKPKAM